MTHIGQKLALLQIGVAVCACLGYLFDGDYRCAIYWGAAAVLTATVTF